MNMIFNAAKIKRGSSFVAASFYEIVSHSIPTLVPYPLPTGSWSFPMYESSDTHQVLYHPCPCFHSTYPLLYQPLVGNPVNLFQIPFSPALSTVQILLFWKLFTTMLTTNLIKKILRHLAQKKLNSFLSMSYKTSFIDSGALRTWLSEMSYSFVRDILQSCRTMTHKVELSINWSAIIAANSMW